MIYNFGDREIDFGLTEEDRNHCAVHRTKMLQWTSPIYMDALSGIDWDKVQVQFPYYSLRCRDCDYRGGDYDRYGKPRLKDKIQ
jgi:hypothetical protein